MELFVVVEYFYVCLIWRTEDDANTRIGKAWNAIESLTSIWKFNLSDEIKEAFIQALAMSVLLYCCTSQTLTKRSEKKLDENYPWMLRVVLKKILEAAPDKTAAVRPLTSHLTSHPSKTSKSLLTMPEKWYMVKNVFFRRILRRQILYA